MRKTSSYSKPHVASLFKSDSAHVAGAKGSPITEARKPSCAVRPTKTCHAHSTSVEPQTELHISNSLGTTDQDMWQFKSVMRSPACLCPTSFFLLNPNSVVPKYSPGESGYTVFPLFVWPARYGASGNCSQQQLLDIRHTHVVHNPALSPSDSRRACIPQSKGFRTWLRRRYKRKADVKRLKNMVEMQIV